MKKLLVPLFAVAVMATLAYAGENYFHTVKAEIGGFATALGVGKSEPADGYVLDVAGASRLVGVPTIVGNPAVTGSASVVGSVAVSTSASSLQGVSFKGAVVTLSTMPVSVGEIWYQVSNNVLYVSTRVPAANVTYCAGTGCYAALH